MPLKRRIAGRQPVVDGPLLSRRRDSVCGETPHLLAQGIKPLGLECSAREDSKRRDDLPESVSLIAVFGGFGSRISAGRLTQ